jgi:tetrahydromethanopterin S-methyltransferase subunit G
MKTLKENNRMIAEFMGLLESSIQDKFWTEKTKDGFGVGELIDLNYHSSWERLMPVVFKIVDDTTVYAQDRQKVFNSINRDITITYDAVIDFIHCLMENKF